METQIHILLLVAVLIWGGTGCTSIEARAKGAQKPFPGIRTSRIPDTACMERKGHW